MNIERGFKRSMARPQSGAGSIIISQQSRSTAAYYPFGSLSKLKLHIHHRPTPGIRARKTPMVIQHKVTSDRKINLSCLTQQLINNFIEVTSQAFGGGDCIAPFSWRPFLYGPQPESHHFEKSRYVFTPPLSIFILTPSLFRMGLRTKMLYPMFQSGSRLPEF